MADPVKIVRLWAPVIDPPKMVELAPLLRVTAEESEIAAEFIVIDPLLVESMSSPILVESISLVTLTDERKLLPLRKEKVIEFALEVALTVILVALPGIVGDPVTP